MSAGKALEPISVVEGASGMTDCSSVVVCCIHLHYIKMSFYDIYAPNYTPDSENQIKLKKLGEVRVE